MASKNPLAVRVERTSALMEGEGEEAVLLAQRATYPVALASTPEEARAIAEAQGNAMLQYKGADYKGSVNALVSPDPLKCVGNQYVGVGAIRKEFADRVINALLTTMSKEGTGAEDFAAFDAFRQYVEAEYSAVSTVDYTEEAARAFNGMSVEGIPNGANIRLLFTMTSNGVETVRCHPSRASEFGEEGNGEGEEE